MAKILNMIETAYRATLEEQDDTILWLTQMFKNAGADVSVVLRSNAVNYAVPGQDASGLSFGDIKMAHAPDISNDLQKMADSGVTVYLVEEDATERGLKDQDIMSAVKKVSRSALPELMDEHDQVWHW